MLHDLIRDAATELPPARDYITTGGLVLVALITVVGGILTALIERGRRETKRGNASALVAAVEAKEAAEQAADLAAPTGNGFATRITDALERIEAQQARQGGEQRRQAQVQRQQARDIGGIREEIRIDRRQLVEHITESRQK